MSVSRPTPYPVLPRVPRSAFHRSVFRYAPKSTKNATRSSATRSSATRSSATRSSATRSSAPAFTPLERWSTSHEPRATTIPIPIHRPAFRVRCAFRGRGARVPLYRCTAVHDTPPHATRNTHRLNELQRYTPRAPMPQVQTIKTAKKHGKKTIKHAKKAENRPTTPPA